MTSLHATEGRSRRGRVFLVCPGGLDSGGGIGRQMGYFLRAVDATASGLTYRVVDSRGPRLIGHSVRDTAFGVLRLGGTALQLLSARLFGPRSIAHINIAGHGSTVRKTMLASFAQCIGLPYLLHVHDYDYAEDYRRRGSMMQWLVRRAFEKATRVLVLGSRDENSLCALLNIRREDVVVLHNAVPDPHAAPRSGRLPGEPCHILFLGHLSARKGLPELMHALASPAVAARNWRATLAGIGESKRFHRLAAQLGIADRVTFPGWLDQAGVRAACETAEILVLPSHGEGLAMAILEGLSYGLAVVATPVGAHAEVIEAEISGLFVPPGDEAALAAALLRVIDDDALRARLRIGARRRFLEKFEVSAYSARLAELHAALLAE